MNNTQHTATIKMSDPAYLRERNSGRPLHPALSSLLAERADVLQANATYLLFKTRKAALNASRAMQSAGYAVALPSWPIPMVIKCETPKTWVLEVMDAWPQAWREVALAAVSLNAA